MTDIQLMLKNNRPLQLINKSKKADIKQSQKWNQKMRSSLKQKKKTRWIFTLKKDGKFDLKEKDCKALFLESRRGRKPVPWYFEPEGHLRCVS